MKNKRLAILQEIDRLDSFRCSKCEGSGKVQNTVYCDCPSAESIRKLGDELLLLIGSRKGLTGDTVESLFEKPFNPENYLKMKESGLMDVDIIEGCKIGRNALYKFKKEHGLFEIEREMRV